MEVEYSEDVKEIDEKLSEIKEELIGIHQVTLICTLIAAVLFYIGEYTALKVIGGLLALAAIWGVLRGGYLSITLLASDTKRVSNIIAQTIISIGVPILFLHLIDYREGNKGQVVLDAMFLTQAGFAAFSAFILTNTLKKEPIACSCVVLAFGWLIIMLGSKSAMFNDASDYITLVSVSYAVVFYIRYFKKYTI